MANSNKILYYLILPLATSIIGFIFFCLLFQGLEHWGDHTMRWYWARADLAYVFSVLSLVLVIVLMVKDYKIEKGKIILIFCYSVEFVSAILSCVTMLLTAYAIIVWQSKI